MTSAAEVSYNTVHTSVHSSTVKLRYNVQIQKAIVDNVPKINTMNFIPRRNRAPPMHTRVCTQAHFPNA